MIDGTIPFGLRPDDLAFEHYDPVVEFLDRKRVQVLRDNRSERIARRVRENLVDVHGEDR